MSDAPSHLKLPPLLKKAKEEGWAKWIQSAHDERAVLNGCIFHEDSADWVVSFIESYCRHSKGKWAGKKFELMEWQRDKLIKPIFGWLKPDGTRRINHAYCEVPKKNGKSTLASAVGLYMLCADGEAGSEVYAAATKREQAKIVWQEAVSMVQKSPQLSKDLKIIQTTNRIIYPSEGSKFETLAAEARGAEGLNPHCILADELHVWHGREFWNSLRYGNVARSQPLMFVITTAGILDKTTVGWSEHAYALQWLADESDNQEYYALIYGAKESDNHELPEIHKQANPSYGITIKPDEIKKNSKLATEKKSELGPFLRYRLNVWTEQADSFFNMLLWREGNKEIDVDDLVSRSCFAGLDLASKIDVAAWVLVFPPEEDDGDWIVLPRFFVPKGSAEKREAEDGVQYETWGRQNFVELTNGDVIDYSAILEQIKEDSRLYDIKSVGADPWNLEYFRQRLLDEIPDLELVEFGQSFRFMSEPTKKLEALVINKQLVHGNNPVLQWMAANSVPKEDNNGNIKIDKKRSREKVDGIIALIMAIGRAMADQQEDSVYDTEGIFFV